MPSYRMAAQNASRRSKEEHDAQIIAEIKERMKALSPQVRALYPFVSPYPQLAETAGNIPGTRGTPLTGTGIHGDYCVYSLLTPGVIAELRAVGLPVRGKVPIDRVHPCTVIDGPHTWTEHQKEYEKQRFAHGVVEYGAAEYGVAECGAAHAEPCNCHKIITAIPQIEKKYPKLAFDLTERVRLLRMNPAHKGPCMVCCCELPPCMANHRNFGCGHMHPDLVSFDDAFAVYEEEFAQKNGGVPQSYAANPVPAANNPSTNNTAGNDDDNETQKREPSPKPRSPLVAAFLDHVPANKAPVAPTYAAAALSAPKTASPQTAQHNQELPHDNDADDDDDSGAVSVQQESEFIATLYKKPEQQNTADKLPLGDTLPVSWLIPVFDEFGNRKCFVLMKRE